VPAELGGRAGAVRDKSLYQNMEMAIQNGDLPGPGSLDADEQWFALCDGDRIRLLEIDVDQEIGRVEVLSGFSAGRTCWLSLSYVKRD
jgi:hypothetical protein